MSGDRVTLDPRELDELGDLMQHLHHRHRVIHKKLQALRPGLGLETHVAPDAQASTTIRGLLDAAEQALLPIAQASLSDESSLRKTAQLARKAGDGPDRRLPKAEVARLVDSLTGKSPEEKAVIEAGLLGGIGKVKDGYTAPDLGGKKKASEGDAVKDVLALALKQKGTAEKGDNLTKYGEWYGNNGVPWCAIFVSWVFAKSGHPLPELQAGDGSKTGFAGVASGAEALKEKGLLHDEPKVGSIWLHRGDTPEHDHTGIVTEVRADGSFTTVEGNSGNEVRTVDHPASEKKSSYGFGWVL